VNKSRGDGEAKLEARLIDVVSGQSYQETAKVELRGGERTTKRVEIRAPERAYRAEAQVTYPAM
jgi:hypothetical protein